jgi:hypothetical protein
MTPRVLPSSSRPRPAHASGHDTSYWPLHKSAVGHTLGDLAFGLMTPRVLPSSSRPLPSRARLKGPPITMIPCTCFSPRPRPSRVRPRHQLLAAAQVSCWAHPWRSRLRADDPSGVAFQLKTVTIPSSLERSAHNHDPMHLLQSKTTSFTRPATTPAIGRCTSQLLGTPLAISPSG